MVYPYKFTYHDRVPNKPPVTKMTQLFDRLNTGENLSREEKDKVFDGLYGMGGSKSGVYKISGWAFPFHQLLKRFIVCFDGDWSVYYALHKTSIRNCRYINDGIDEIHEISNK